MSPNQPLAAKLSLAYSDENYIMWVVYSALLCESQISRLYSL